MGIIKYKLDRLLNNLEGSKKEVISKSLSDMPINKVKEYISAFELGLKYSPESKRENIIEKLFEIKPKYAKCYGEGLMWGLVYVDGDIKEKEMIIDSLLEKSATDARIYGYGLCLGLKYIPNEYKSKIAKILLEKEPSEAKNCGIQIEQLLEWAYESKKNKRITEKEKLLKKVYKRKKDIIAEILDIDKSEI